MKANEIRHGMMVGLLLIGAAAPARAQGQDGAPPAGGQQLLGQLGLSDAQQSELEAIREASRAGVAEELGELREVRAELRELLSADVPDQVAIDAARADATALRSVLDAARAEARTAVGGVLTADQQSQLETLRAERQTQRQGRPRQGQANGRGGFGGGRPGGRPPR